MKKPLITFLFSVFIVPLLFAQDIITKKTGEDIPAKVLEVTQTEVKFKKYDNPEGPTFTLAKSDLFLIRYENKTKELFLDPAANSATETSLAKTAETPLNAEELYTQGRLNAQKHYRGYVGAGTGTLVVSLLSPLAGLVPAVICSSTTPRNSNLLDNPNHELMRNASYNKGYLQKSKRIKSGRVWRNWGIGLGANLLAVILLTNANGNQ